MAIVAAQFQADGIEPIARLVQPKLGGGSNSTIGSFLRTWRTVEQKRGEELPPVLVTLVTPDADNQRID